MKALVRGLLALGLLGLAGAARADKIAPEPAATLLLPYFEVDLVDPTGVNTVFSVNNAYGNPVLTHVTLWSDLAVPVLSFDLYLTGYDVQTVDLRDILVNGLEPQTAVSGLGCGGSLPPPPLPAIVIHHLQMSLTGRGSPLFGGLCAGRNLGDDIARGYVTVDTVDACFAFFPDDPAYFPIYATGDNVLWGDYFYLRPGPPASAAGNTLVHIPAQSPAPPPGDYTFYGRYVGWLGTDQRHPLATSFAARYMTGGALPRTDLIVWRDPKVAQQPGRCPMAPFWYPLGQEGIAVFDEQENLDLVPPGLDPFPAAAQRVEVGGADFPVPFSFGWINLNLNTLSSVPPADPAAAQAWVAVSIDSGGPFEMGYDAIQIDNASQALHQVPP